MKSIKVFITLLLFSVCTAVFSQTHLKFVGIPIDGTITQFQTKLSTKGFKHNKAESANAPVGQRVFNGLFRSRNAELTVFYNRKTLIVYKVEVGVSSKSMPVMQSFLDKSIRDIESTYKFTTNHDVDDPTSMHYRYSIFQDEKNIGSITINPTTSYLIDNNGQIVGSEPLVEYVYEDKVNTDALTPSTREPKLLRNLVLSDENFFNKNVVWAANFKQNGCFASYIFRLNWLLDCYKLNCGVPAQFVDKEQDIEDAILEAETYAFAEMPTAYSKEITTVYKLTASNNPQKIEGLTYMVNSDMMFIRLNKSQIAKQIEILKQLKSRYNTKNNTLTNKERNNYWTEKIDLTLPATLGKDRLTNGFGDIKWDDKLLTIRFAYHERVGLKVEVLDDYMDVLCFWNTNMIDNYINILEYALKR